MLAIETQFFGLNQLRIFTEKLSPYAGLNLFDY